MIVIGHRGASGYRPEHTLAAYELAIELGADYIEPDLVSTRDHVLVVRHENEISATTDVADHPEFADRRATRTIDGVSLTGWFTEDFTLAELRTLRARERIPDLRPDNVVFNGRYHIPTFQEVIDLAKRAGIGIYPETKHPTYFRSIGLPLEEPLVRALDASGYRGPNASVFVQSFEVGNLRRLRRMTEVPLVQLLDDRGRPYDLVLSGDPRSYADLATPMGLAELAAHVQGIGPSKRLIVPCNADNRRGSPTALVGDAHRAGLLVHPWTLRRENAFLPEDLRRGDPASPAYLRAVGDLPAELRQLCQLGVDGLFSDNPDLAVAIRDELSGTRGSRSAHSGPLHEAGLGG
ncbi:MAG TPA: glycerophosphodiester phosphodiesterase [Actinomycetota bacterium]|jgi:glycerophosphoryl diester phosphodiesterase|nr:glycerophosphodiester phosphodiesterase [Actinomycetota bacterium]